MTTGSDIVLGVARAADAAKQREAAARLERLSRQPAEVASIAPSADPIHDWSTELRRAGAGEQHPLLPAEGGSSAGGALAAPSAEESAEKRKDVYVQFEAVLLQNMVEDMMPEDSEAMFGSGTAGSMWKSMLAEKVAAEIARSGAVGIAKQVAEGEAARLSVAPTSKAKVDDV